MYKSRNEIYKDIIKILENDIDMDFIEEKDGTTIFSINIKPVNKILLSITNDKSNFYINIDNTYINDIDKNLTIKENKNTNKIIIKNINDLKLLKPIILTIYERILNSYKEFDCCSRYEECSNNLKCVQKDKFLSIGCGYRKKLNQNIIYYGKNRNV